MNTQINRLVDRYISQYQEEISKKYKNVKLETLQNMWLNIDVSTPVKLEKKKKKSAYQNFFGVTRLEIASGNPTLKFGEISSMISQKWKLMTKEEKQEYEEITEEEEKKKDFNNFIDFIEDEETAEVRTTFEDTIHEDVIIDEEDQYDFEDDE
jgi:hypothetical protein